LHSAAREQEIDFGWLDKRSMDPVGDKRVNKGVVPEGDDCVVQSDNEIMVAHPRRTQTLQIEAFVTATDVYFVHLEKPQLPVARCQGAAR
jgi:DNA end-binding protein Ku